jgi:hypothetical protein
MPTPCDQAQLRSFLGMVTYFSQFFSMLADHTAPLNNLLRKEVPWE